ncbi:tocopherol cyclase family protein [Fusibacter bizertensis]
MNKSDLSRNLYMLKGPLAKNGYDWWWHNFTGYSQTTGEAKSFFIEYFICNPGLGNGHPILGQLPTNQAIGRKPSYALIKVGTWGKDAKQIHNFYPVSKFRSDEEKLNISIGDCELSETHLKGKCFVSEEDAAEHAEYMCNAGNMSWQLKLNKKIAYNVGYGASKLLRKINAFEMFWHAEGIKTEYEGIVELDGITYDVIPEKSYGYADKNWGSDFTSPWLWISSCHMKSLLSDQVLENSAVEFGGGKPKVFGKSLNRKLLGGFYYEGKMYDYNFSKFWRRSHIDFEFIEGEKINTWKLKAENRKTVLNLTLECPVDEMLFINYEAPNGSKKHNRLWNGGTGIGKIELLKKHKKGVRVIDLIEIRNVGCEYGTYDAS